jgi:negative regulator of sigma E activity
MTSHPDTEALSAFLDGEAPEVDSHVAACAECRRQLDALGRVRSAVAAPVPPPAPAARDAAVAAALDAVAKPVRDRRRQWTVVVVAGAVAAALLVALVVTRVGTSSKSSNTAAGPVSSNLVRAGDLGNVDDAQGLRAKIEPRLTQTAAQAPDKGAASAAGQSGGGGAGAAATPERRVASEARQAPAEAPRCEGAARALQPGRALLVYVATARWKGTPADVFGFSPAGAPVTGSPGRPTPTRVYVLARSDCHLLVFQSYAP